MGMFRAFIYGRTARSTEVSVFHGLANVLRAHQKVPRAAIRECTQSKHTQDVHSGRAIGRLNPLVSIQAARTHLRDERVERAMRSARYA